MKKAISSLILVLTTLIVGWYSFIYDRRSEDRIYTFMCEDAYVEVNLGPEYKDPTYTFKDTILSVKHEKKDIILRFQPDFFAASCIEGKDNKSYIFFQKYCSGSACIDSDNWGIIDPDTLYILLMPHNNNFYSQPLYVDETIPTRPKNPLYKENIREVKKDTWFLS